MKLEWTLRNFSINLAGLYTVPNAPKIPANRKSLFETAQEKLFRKFASGTVGFYRWPDEVSNEFLERLENTAKRLRDSFEGALLFGIGGSWLGPLAIQQALRSPKQVDDFPIQWLANTDGASVHEADHFLSKYKAASVVISKSGNTTETLSGFFHFSRRLDPNGIVVITDPTSGELRRLQIANQWGTFEVPPNLGGRFSVLSAVGLLPTLLSGLSARGLIEGARAMKSELESGSIEENPAYAYAHALCQWDTERKHNVQYLMPYRANLRPLADWYVQLFGESLGKRPTVSPESSVGFTPVSAVGTADQHSILQLLKEGPSDKVVGFLDVNEGKTLVERPKFETPAFDFLFKHSFEKINSMAQKATQASLSNSGVPCYRIEIPVLNEAALGALFFFFETTCAFAGELYGVDAFNQPGVEESKTILRSSL